MSPDGRLLRAQARLPRHAAAADPELRLVFLEGERELLAERLAHRHGHFFPQRLLTAQLGRPRGAHPGRESDRCPHWTLQPDEIVDGIVAQLTRIGCTDGRGG